MLPSLHATIRNVMYRKYVRALPSPKTITVNKHTSCIWMYVSKVAVTKVTHYLTFFRISLKPFVKTQSLFLVYLISDLGCISLIETFFLKLIVREIQPVKVVTNVTKFWKSLSRLSEKSLLSWLTIFIFYIFRNQNWRTKDEFETLISMKKAIYTWRNAKKTRSPTWRSERSLTLFSKFSSREEYAK